MSGTLATIGVMVDRRRAIAVRVARILYARWERLSPADREPLEPLASDVKRRALDVRGTVDDGQAERELERASDRFAHALGEDEVAALRQELKDELDRAARRAA